MNWLMDLLYRRVYMPMVERQRADESRRFARSLAIEMRVMREKRLAATAEVAGARP